MALTRRAFSTEAAAQYENIIVEHKDGGVAQITLNRPKALNALCFDLYKDLHHALVELDKDPNVGAIVITGSKKAFAAGADIKEMKDREFPDTYLTDMLTWWDNMTKIKKPIIGAVNGYALGGGRRASALDVCEVRLGAEAEIALPGVAVRGVIAEGVPAPPRPPAWPHHPCLALPARLLPASARSEMR